MANDSGVPEGIGPGSLIAGYRLEHRLGEGGMGVVYAATQLSLNRKVALKLVTPGRGEDLTFRERFRREGLAQAALDHPHIVTVYEAGEADGVLFIAMRLVDGSSLKEMITARELDAGRTLRILRPVADALDSAHEAGLIHRDVKPHNILVGRRDQAFLADFGLTKLRDGASLTRSGQFVGSLDYVSPEQIRGDRASTSSDIYALGAVLFECLTGIVPFPKDSEAAVLYAHMSDPPPRVSEARPELPAELDAIIAMAMAKDPAARHRDAAQLIEMAHRTFAFKTRAAMAVPAPVERAVQEGVRAPEAEVDTAPSRATHESPPVPTPVPETVSEAVPQPEVEALPAPARRSPLSVVAAAAAALAVVAGGFLLGRQGEKAPAGGSRALTAGTVTVTAPAGWRESPNLVPIEGLAFSDEVALEAPSGAGTMRVGRLDDSATGRTLLPPAFRAANLEQQRAVAAVSLGELEANRLTYARLPGPGAAGTIYTSPTTKGVLGVACTGAPGALQRCEEIANTAVLDGAQPLELGPSKAYAAVLARVVDDHAGSRSLIRDAEHADDRDRQAELLDRLSERYGALAERLTDAEPDLGAAGPHTALLEQVRDTARGYKALASAARSDDERAYAKARAETDDSLAGVRQWLDHLAGLGYGERV